MDIYNSSELLNVFSDPFSEKSLKDLDSLDLTVYTFPRKTRIDLMFDKETSENLPIYVYINRLTDFESSSLSVPSDSGQLSRALTKLSGEK